MEKIISRRKPGTYIEIENHNDKLEETTSIALTFINSL